jgi:hypothetical protein
LLTDSCKNTKKKADAVPRLISVIAITIYALPFHFINFAELKKIFMFSELSTGELVWGIVIAVVLSGSLAYLFWKQRKEAKLNEDKAKDAPPVATKQLQLQAYERLLLLTDRIAIPNLVNRVNQPTLSAREMQSLLTQSLRQEFEHNITQQMYVTPEAWDAVKNLKEQNLLIINQVASFLPENATAFDLNKSLLELTAQNPKVSLHSVVAEALSYEAKKLMK